MKSVPPGTLQSDRNTLLSADQERKKRGGINPLSNTVGRYSFKRFKYLFTGKGDVFVPYYRCLRDDLPDVVG